MIQETSEKKGEQKERAMRQHRVNPFQTVEIPENVAIKRIIKRVGKNSRLWMTRFTDEVAGPCQFMT